MIVVKIGDGMGNQLFNYACGYALARREGETLKLDISECDNSTLRDYELDFFRVRYDAKESFPNRNFWQKLYKRLRRNLLYHVIIERDLFSVDTRIYKKTFGAAVICMGTGRMWRTLRIILRSCARCMCRGSRCGRRRRSF